MINIPLEKLLFIDIETVGVQSDWESLKKSNLELSFVFENYIDWFQKRFPEDADKPVGQMFVNRAALVPEFARIACVSVAFVTDKGETKCNHSVTKMKKICYKMFKNYYVELVN
jgi:hypothetical protein